MVKKVKAKPAFKVKSIKVRKKRPTKWQRERQADYDTGRDYYNRGFSMSVIMRPRTIANSAMISGYIDAMADHLGGNETSAYSRRRRMLAND